jgi:hypothetical protein
MDAIQIEIVVLVWLLNIVVEVEKVVPAAGANGSIPAKGRQRNGD